MMSMGMQAWGLFLDMVGVLLFSFGGGLESIVWDGGRVGIFVDNGAIGRNLRHRLAAAIKKNWNLLEQRPVAAFGLFLIIMGFLLQFIAQIVCV
jgi:hypothetical protein